jgi:hypothetical protein
MARSAAAAATPWLFPSNKPDEHVPQVFPHVDLAKTIHASSHVVVQHAAFAAHTFVTHVLQPLVSAIPG